MVRVKVDRARPFIVLCARTRPVIVLCEGCGNAIEDGESCYALRSGSIQGGKFVREDTVIQLFHQGCDNRATSF